MAAGRQASPWSNRCDLTHWENNQGAQMVVWNLNTHPQWHTSSIKIYLRVGTQPAILTLGNVAGEETSGESNRLAFGGSLLEIRLNSIWQSPQEAVLWVSNLVIFNRGLYSSFTSLYWILALGILINIRIHVYYVYICIHFNFILHKPFMTYMEYLKCA